MSFSRSLQLHQEVVASVTPRIGKLFKLKCAVDVWRREQTGRAGSERYMGTLPHNTLVVLLGVEPYRTDLTDRITFQLLVTTGANSGVAVIVDNYGTTPEQVLSWFEWVVP
jgi:hypothetical protein